MKWNRLFGLREEKGRKRRLKGGGWSREHGRGGKKVLKKSRDTSSRRGKRRFRC